MIEPLIIASIPKNSTEDLRVTLGEFKGRQLLDLRVFADFGGPAKVKMPSKKGVSVNVAMFPALREALAEAEAQARSLGLLVG